MDKKAIYQAVEFAVEQAFKELSIADFKKTSMFMSNSRRNAELEHKVAA